MSLHEKTPLTPTADDQRTEPQVTTPVLILHDGFAVLVGGSFDESGRPRAPSTLRNRLGE